MADQRRRHERGSGKIDMVVTKDIDRKEKWCRGSPSGFSPFLLGCSSSTLDLSEGRKLTGGHHCPNSIAKARSLFYTPALTLFVQRSSLADCCRYHKYASQVKGQEDGGFQFSIGPSLEIKGKA